MWPYGHKITMQTIPYDLVPLAPACIDYSRLIPVLPALISTVFPPPTCWQHSFPGKDHRNVSTMIISTMWVAVLYLGNCSEHHSLIIDSLLGNEPKICFSGQDASLLDYYPRQHTINNKTWGNNAHFYISLNFYCTFSCCNLNMGHDSFSG